MIDEKKFNVLKELNLEISSKLVEYHNSGLINDKDLANADESWRKAYNFIMNYLDVNQFQVGYIGDWKEYIMEGFFVELVKKGFTFDKISTLWPEDGIIISVKGILNMMPNFVRNDPEEIFKNILRIKE